MVNNEKEILAHVPGTVLEEEIVFNYEVKTYTRLQLWLARKFSFFAKRYPAKRQLIFKPVTLGTLMQISKILMSIEDNILDKDNVLPSVYNTAINHGEKVAEVIVLACQGKPGKADKNRMKEVIENFTINELQGVFHIILGQMNVVGFMTSITSMRGLNLLKVSQKVEGEIIAPHGIPGALLGVI